MKPEFRARRARTLLGGGSVLLELKTHWLGRSFWAVKHTLGIQRAANCVIEPINRLKQFTVDVKAGLAVGITR